MNAYAPPEPGVPGDLDQARAHLYTLLAQMLARPPDAGLLARLTAIEGDTTPLGQALSELAERAARTSAETAEREYNRLFIGLERGELVPYASYYRTGFLYDRPLALLRQDMAALGVERLPGVSEPEDHIAGLCEIMAGLVTGEVGPVGEAGQRRFFQRHLEPWADRLFEDLERAGSADLYRPVGTIGRRFLEIEAALLATATEAGETVADPAAVGRGSLERGGSDEERGAHEARAP